MDPITAALNLATEVVKLIILIIETTPPELRAAQAEQAAKDLRLWQAFIEKLSGGQIVLPPITKKPTP